MARMVVVAPTMTTTPTTKESNPAAASTCSMSVMDRVVMQMLPTWVVTVVVKVVLMVAMVCLRVRLMPSPVANHQRGWLMANWRRSRRRCGCRRRRAHLTDVR